MPFKSTRLSMLIFVSLTNSKLHETIYSYCTSVHANSFTHSVDIGPVTISPVTSVTRGAGENLSLECSVEIIPNPLPQNVPSPTIEWFFGPNNGSLPPGVTPMATVMGSGNSYNSTLQFSPLQQSHAGMYTCRLGSNARLAVNATLTGEKYRLSIATSYAYRQSIIVLSICTQ